MKKRKFRALLFSLAIINLLGIGQACGSISPSAYRMTQEYAVMFGLETDLLVALIWIESRYCPKVVSPAGAIGLGQLMPNTARSLKVNPRDPRQNLYGAAKYLRAQWDRFHDWSLALAAYNAGATTVRRYGAVPPYLETQNYVRSVLYVYHAIKRR